MYLADSARGVIRRYPVDPATGDLGTAQTFVTVSDGSPDGMTTDSEGGLWTAVWGTGQVHRYCPDGSLDRIVDLPAGQPAGALPRRPRRPDPPRHQRAHRPARTGTADGAVFALGWQSGTPAAPYRPADRTDTA